MAILQKMKWKGGKTITTCIVDEVSLGGEFTICGYAIPDSLLSEDGYERDGEAFEGSLKKCTCPQCKRRLNYYKNLK